MPTNPVLSHTKIWNYCVTPTINIFRVEAIPLDLQQIQSQQLQLTPSMRLALFTLQLPLCDLEAYLLRQSNENPMLDVHDPEDRTFPISSAPSNEDYLWETDYSGNRHGASLSSSGLEYQSDTDWLTPSFSRQIIDQLCQERLIPPEYLPHCIFLAESLDKRGYFTENLEEIATLLDISYQTVEQALYMLQEMHPTGVGARNLKECLLLQLIKSPHLNESTLTLISQDFSLYETLDFKWMAQLLGTNESEAKAYWKIIQELNPIPSRGFTSDRSMGYVIPEATVERQGDYFVPRFHRKYSPTAELNPTYAELLKTSNDPTLLTFLQPHRVAAEQVLYAIQRRQTTLEKIISYVVAQQQDFFSDGMQSLSPLTISQVAEELSVHASTISRGVRDKYLTTPQGLIPLKQLFSVKVSGENLQGDSVSRAAVASRIRMLVSAEDKSHPLSDTKLQEILTGLSIHISRRTVAKYRGEMGIAGSSQRKQNK